MKRIIESYCLLVLLLFLTMACGKGLTTSVALQPGDIEGLLFWMNPHYYLENGTVNGADFHSDPGTGHSFPGQFSLGSSLTFTSGGPGQTFLHHTNCPNSLSQIDNTTGMYISDLLSLTSVTGHTAFFVGTLTGVAQAAFSFTFDSTATASDNFIQFGQTSPGTIDFTVSSLGNTINVSQTYLTNDVFGYITRWNGSTGEAKLIIRNPTTYFESTNNTPFNNLANINYFRLFSNPTSASFYSGAMCEIIVYNRALTDDEILDVNEYLEAKYY